MKRLLEYLKPIRALFNYTHDGVLFTDLKGLIQVHNDSVTKITGYTSDDLIGTSCEAFQQEPKIDFPEIIQSLLNKNTLAKEIICIRKDGKKIPVKTCFSLLRNKDNNPVGMMISIKDESLTEPEIEFMNKQEHILRALNFRHDEYCYIGDVISRRFTFCTDTVENVLGYTSDEFINGGYALGLSSVPEDSLNDLMKQFEEAIKRWNKEPFEHDNEPMIIEYNRRHKNGKWIWVHSEYYVLDRDENRQVRHIIGFVRDDSQAKMHGMDLSEKDVLDLFNDETTDLIRNIDIVRGSKMESGNSVPLSEREKEILSLIKVGLSTKLISARLGLTVNTVNTYRKNLMAKLNAKNSAELVKISMERNIS
ncbi:MAG: PAS domain-containing protein [Bacteroidetes bacterium]|nr:MAG: PAS domain-containing protein [Bacteroidota bacterium]REK04668.1 MAG: PAS domain-containing protein [Bacteroidota bacterium]REK36143.1 MAG: PAS domain-containing protein [Bacteroidota bacterium]REK51486.1 MAG: PAS domain-containing protein [Bacteroidota bacterium]